MQMRTQLWAIREVQPENKKRVPLSVPREQRVNALCMEKSVLHGFGRECGK